MSDLHDVLAVDDSANEDDLDEHNDFESDSNLDAKTDAKGQKRQSGAEKTQKKKDTADESALTKFFTGMLK